MFSEEKMSASTKKYRALLIFIVLFGGLSICMAQETLQGRMEDDTLISKGENKTPFGPLGVTTYRLEKVYRLQPIDPGDGKPPVNYHFRLVINTAKDIPVSGFVIWIGRKALVAYAADPRTVAVLITARTLPNGAALALSTYGEHEKANKSILPEKLDVGPEYATTAEELLLDRPVVQLRRSGEKFSWVELRIEIPRMPCYIGAMPFVIEIGEKGFGADCHDKLIVYRFPVDVLNRLPEGAEIAVKHGGGSSSIGRVFVGRLEKKSVR